MPITGTDLKQYQAANMPEDDTGASGGAINTAGITAITPLAANDALEAVSDNAADTMNLTLTGRNAAGAIVSETKALNGTTVVSFSVLGTLERVLKAILASAATGTITIRRAGGGATVVTLSPGIASARRMFYAASSEAGATTRYEKIFWRNAHGTLTLNAATMKLTADPSAKVMIGTDPAKNGGDVSANRKTAPAGVTFVDDNLDAGIPGGNLAAGENIGVWVRMDLLASDAPLKSSFTTKLAGTTT